MIEYYLAGAGLRATQIVVDAAIWIATGCLIAAIFRRIVGPKHTRAFFGDTTKFGVLIGWLLGMLLPVCSLGVIPIVRELHRSSVKGGTIIAFGLTAPLFNPMSVLYGLTLSDPIAILSFSFCALVIVSCLGLGWDWMFPATTRDETEEKLPQVGIKRVLTVLFESGRQLVNWSMVFIVAGILGSVLLTVLLPKGSMQTQAEPDKVLAPVFMAFVSTPLYATPLQVMAQIGGMFQHGNSIGAAFSLLILGAGANLGLLGLFAGCFGIRRVVVFFVMLLSVTIGLAYCIDKPLYPKGVHPAGHTHAFDVYTHPYDRTQTGLWGLAASDIVEFRRSNDFGGTYLLAAMLLVGIGSSIQRSKWDAWLLSEQPSSGKFDRILPGWAVGVVSVVGLIVLSVYGAFVYYLPANELLEDLNIINTEVVLAARTKEWDSVVKWVPYCDDLSRRLEVGVFLREGSVREFQSAKAENYREKLDELRDAVEDENFANIDDMAMDVYEAYRQMSKAFKKEDTG